MRLLKVLFEQKSMFTDGLASIDLYAEDRVPPTDGSVYCLKRPVYANKVLALAGINATGKTTMLGLLELAINVLSGQPLASAVSNGGVLRRLLLGFRLRLVFEHQSQLYILDSTIEPDLRMSDSPRRENLLAFSDEVLYHWDGAAMPKKAQLAEIDELVKGCSVHLRREELDADRRSFLSHNVSIAASVTGGGVPCSFQPASDDQLDLESGSGITAETMRVFDPSIERLELVGEDARSCVLTFKNGFVAHTTVDLLGLYLSSGTSKGLRLVSGAVSVLKRGGYLLVDEIENHLNKQLVGVVIDLFQSQETNPRGATLIFTTHYPEILDRVHRKDNVYFLSRDSKDHLISAVKYSSKVKRIENKKSEVFLSNSLGGTAPRYTDVMALRELVKKVVGNAGE